MHPTLRWSLRGLTVVALSACAVLGVTATAGAAVHAANPQSFSSIFRAAAPGDVVQLSSGSYGTFSGGSKAGMVTVRAAPGATASMKVVFRPARNITLDGLSITDLDIGQGSSNITVRNSLFDRSQATIHTGELSNANIVLDHDRFMNFDACSGCGEGRVFLPGKTGQPSGVTIQNSLFSGGNSDGIQNGGRGVRIIGNEFTGIHQVDGADGVHADSIQLYGSSSTVIRGNWFHDVATGVMCADGCDHEDIEDNVFAVSGSPYAVTLLSDNGSMFRHNTLLDHGTCDYHQRCGVLYLGNKDSDPSSRGTTVIDNILTRICVCDGSSSGLAREDYNLFTNASGSGGSDQRGRPTYSGGANPSSFAGFQLAAGSMGKGNASDGTDRGARITPPSTPAPTAPGGSPPRSKSPSKAKHRRGLVAAYDFDRRRGSRVRDVSGHGHGGRIHGAKHVRHGRRGGALAFRGRDVVAVPDAKGLRLRTRMTLEAWVRPSGRAGSRAVLGKRRGRGLSYGLVAHRGRPAAVPRGRAHAARHVKRLRGGRWTHLAVTFDGRTLRLYVNGRRVAAHRHRQPLRLGRGKLLIGAGAKGQRHFRGRIDDVRIYSRALGRGAIRHDMRTRA